MVVALVIYTRAILFPFYFPSTGEATVNTADTPFLIVIYVAVYCVTALLVLTRARQILVLLAREKFILFLLILAALSAVWSIAPAHTLSRTVALVGSALFGLYFAISFSRSQQLELLGLAFYVVIGLSLAAVILFPDIAIMEGKHEGLWRGIFIHKNSLGKITALAALVFFLLALQKNRNGSRHWIGFCLSLAVLVMSCSKSALLSSIIIFLFFFGYLAYMRHYKPAAIALLFVLIAGSSLVLQIKEGIFAPVVISQALSGLSAPEQVTLREETTDTPSDLPVQREPSGDALAGEKPGFGPKKPNMQDLLTGTNRKVLWTHLWVAVRAHPWLGHGFGGFWLGESGPSATVMRELNWSVSIRSAHNGFLNLMLELGFVGLIAYIAAFSTALFRESRNLLRSPANPISLFYPLVLGYIFLANIGESDLVTTNHIFWVLFVTIATKSSSEVRRRSDKSIATNRKTEKSQATQI